MLPACAVGKHPPFLLVYADNDFSHSWETAEDFCKALQRVHCQARCLKGKDRTHGSVATKIAEEGDPVQQAFVEFITRHAAKREGP
jgi:hypothetical protein